MKLTQESINQINLFEKITRARVKDVFQEDGVLVFLVEEGNIQRALGKEGSNVKRLEKMFKRKIRLLSFSTDPVKFINNLLYPVKAESITVDGDVAVIKAKDNTTKGKIFGREKTNLQKIKTFVKRYHNIQEVKVE